MDIVTSLWGYEFYNLMDALGIKLNKLIAINIRN
jgi:hypothetical protein